MAKLLELDLKLMQYPNPSIAAIYSTSASRKGQSARSDVFVTKYNTYKILYTKEKSVILHVGLLPLSKFLVRVNLNFTILFFIRFHSFNRSLALT